MRGVYTEMLVVEQSEEGKDVARRFEEIQHTKDGEVTREDTSAGIVITRKMAFELKEEEK